VTGLVRGLLELEPPPDGRVALVASRVRGTDALLALGVPVETIGLPSRLLVKAWDLGAAAVGRGHSVVHATSMALPRSPVPLVAMVHDLAWRELPASYPGRGRRWHEAALQRTLRRAGWFVVPSDEVAGQLRELVPRRDADRVVVVGEGCDHLPPPDFDGARRALETLGVRDEFLLSVGTLEPRKNLQRLFDAYELARRSLPCRWPLVVVGPDGWGAALTGARPDGVALAGSVTAGVLSALYATCRCLAYVPLREGFGLPVVEAMRAGSPVVASPVPSAGGASLEVDPLDIDAIASGLVAAASDGPRRDALVAAGRTRTADMTWARTAEAHVAVWRAAAGLPP
jgi:glycosyltransferase involved in cell wall biosynthesis